MAGQFHVVKIRSDDVAELRNMDRKLPAIVYVHGYRGFRLNLDQANYARRIARDGYAVFVPNSFACTWRTERCWMQNGADMSLRLDEIRNAVARIRDLRRSWIFSTRIALVDWFKWRTFVAATLTMPTQD